MRWLLIIPILLFAFAGRAHAQINSGCSAGVLVWTPISLSTGATQTIVPGVLNEKVYICKLFLQTSSANNVAIVEGTGTNCSTVSAGIFGGTTSGTGFIMGANGNLSMNGDASAWGVTATPGDQICLINSASTQLSGVMVTVTQ